MASVKEILKGKNVDVELYYSSAYDDEDGDHIVRDGKIKKVLLVPSESFGDEPKDSKVGVVIDTFYETIGFTVLSEQDPRVDTLFWALLADRDIRRMIKWYGQYERKNPYRIWKHVGYSGCEDIYISVYHNSHGFATSKTKKLVHISCYNEIYEFGTKLDNESLPMIWIGDFVEVANTLGLVDDMSIKGLRKKAKCKYLFPFLWEETKKYELTTSSTKLL